MSRLVSRQNQLVITVVFLAPCPNSQLPTHRQIGTIYASKLRTYSVLYLAYCDNVDSITIHRTFSYLPLPRKIGIDWAFGPSAMDVTDRKDGRTELRSTGVGEPEERHAQALNRMDRVDRVDPPDIIEDGRSFSSTPLTGSGNLYQKPRCPHCPHSRLRLWRDSRVIVVSPFSMRIDLPAVCSAWIFPSPTRRSGKQKPRAASCPSCHQCDPISPLALSLLYVTQ